MNAASNVVNEHGAAPLTLDATAAAAGVSKGGLLYHFPSKDQQIEALLDAYLDGFDARIEALLKSNGGFRTRGPISSRIRAGQL
ncbi:MAG: TetR/AcrR family transcriptional regulator [Chloroflexi bacterium]|nr:TetR/AcrR family transcriptional regulator [Chloroflexota bacterium]